MLDVNEINKLQKYVNKHMPPPDPIAEKGASGGMFPDSCCGFLPQADGSVIRVEVEENDSVPGPGKYDPVYPSFLSKSFQYMKPSNYHKKEKPTPSAADYTHIPKPTRLAHLLNPTDPYPVDPPYLSGDLAHPDWTHKESKILPRNRFPSAEFRTDNSTGSFYSSSNRTLFPELQRLARLPSPDRYNPVKGMGSIEKFEKSSSQFMSEFNRFPPSVSVSPSPDTYTLPDVFGTAQTKEIVEPNQKIEILSQMLKHRNYGPYPLQYAPEIINKPAKLDTESPPFKSKVPRYTEPGFLPPPSTKYNISRKNQTFAMDIRARTTKPGDEWYETPIKDTPCCTAYNINRNLEKKGGYISTTSHKTYQTTPDYPLGFRSVHSSLIKPSFNIHYQRILRQSQSKIESLSIKDKSKHATPENSPQKKPNTTTQNENKSNTQEPPTTPKK